MFKEVFKALKKENLINQSMDEISQLFELNKESFNIAATSLIKNINKDKVYEKDKEINRKVKAIRRKILEHLTINPEQDVVSSLILLEVAINLERIGDFSKNITGLELGLLGSENTGPFIEKLMNQIKVLLKMFNSTKKAFFESDEKLANKVILMHEKNKELEKQLFNEMKKTKNLTVNKAMALALLNYYLKRVSALLENIATSVVNPFDRIGFSPKK